MVQQSVVYMKCQMFHSLVNLRQPNLQKEAELSMCQCVCKESKNVMWKLVKVVVRSLVLGQQVSGTCQCGRREAVNIWQEVLRNTTHGGGVCVCVSERDYKWCIYSYKPVVQCDAQALTHFMPYLKTKSQHCKRRLLNNHQNHWTTELLLLLYLFGQTIIFCSELLTH